MEFLRQSDEILSVGEFSRRFKMLVKTHIPELWLKGEISNLKNVFERAYLFHSKR